MWLVGAARSSLGGISGRNSFYWVSTEGNKQLWVKNALKNNTALVLNLTYRIKVNCKTTFFEKKKQLLYSLCNLLTLSWL